MFYPPTSWYSSGMWIEQAVRLLVVASVVASCAKDKAPPPKAEPPAENQPAAQPPAVQEPSLHVSRSGTGEPTIVFLHGGPGYNSALFDATTAGPLGEHFTVVTYDRRGSGRSVDAATEDAFTFSRAQADLHQILEGSQSPLLVGHSFGGALALRYLDDHPEFDGKLVLLNAPISYPRSLRTIIDNCRKVYESKSDTGNLAYLDKLEAMDPASSQYAGFTFAHGLSCGLYQPSKPTAAAAKLLESAAAHPAAKYFSESRPEPFVGFLEHEKYTTMDLSDLVSKHAERIHAVYGAEDRIISPDDRAFLRKALGDRYHEIPGAAHNLFVDQQPAFLSTLQRIAKHAP